ncbi:MAG: YggT family protein [Lactobacillales bacterium]|jgi:YggT family protein|nr:YggT family protein [Lactobacillales bacterium]
MLAFIIGFFVKIIEVYMVMIIINVILSWFPKLSDNLFGRFITKLTNPYLSKFKKMTFAGFDFASLVAFIVLIVLETGLAVILGAVNN